MVDLILSTSKKYKHTFHSDKSGFLEPLMANDQYLEELKQGILDNGTSTRGQHSYICQLDEQSLSFLYAETDDGLLVTNLPLRTPLASRYYSLEELRGKKLLHPDLKLGFLPRSSIPAGSEYKPHQLVPLKIAPVKTGETYEGVEVHTASMVQSTDYALCDSTPQNSADPYAFNERTKVNNVICSYTNTVTNVYKWQRWYWSVTLSRSRISTPEFPRQTLELCNQSSWLQQAFDYPNEEWYLDLKNVTTGKAEPSGKRDYFSQLLFYSTRPDLHSYATTFCQRHFKELVSHLYMEFLAEDPNVYDYRLVLCLRDIQDLLLHHHSYCWHREDRLKALFNRIIDKGIVKGFERL